MAIECFDIPARFVLAQIHSIWRLFNSLAQLVGSSLMKSEITPEILHPTQRKCLSPMGVVPIVESFATAVWGLLEKEGPKLEGVSTPLLDFVLPVLYQSSAYAFFGRSCPAAESYEPFRDFDRTFHLLLAGVPRVFLRKHTKGLHDLRRLFEKYFDSPHNDASEFVLGNERVVRDHGYVCPLPCLRKTSGY